MQDKWCFNILNLTPNLTLYIYKIEVKRVFSGVKSLVKTDIVTDIGEGSKAI